MPPRALQMLLLATFLLAFHPGLAATLEFLKATSTQGDSIADVAGDGAGNLFICGATRPTAHAGRVIALGSKSSTYGFISKLSESGAMLGTVALRGTVSGVSKIAVDRQHRLVAAGVAGPDDSFAAMSANSSTSRIFVCTLDASGTNLLRKTLFAANTRFKAVQALAIDGSGNVFVAGHADPGAFPGAQTIGPVATNFPHPFVAKLEAQGALEHVTVFGGSGYDFLEALAVNAAGDVCAAGWTYSQDFPRSGDPAFDDSLYNARAFVVKLARDGRSLVSSTLLGSDCDTRATSLAVDDAGSIYVAGSSCSSEFLGLAPGGSAFPARYRGYFTKLDAAGTNVLFTKFVGLTDLDSIAAIQLRPDGTALLAGTLDSSFNSAGFPFVATSDAEGNLAVRTLTAACGPRLTLDRLNLDAGGHAYARGFLHPSAIGTFGGSYAARVNMRSDLSTEPPLVLLAEPVPNSIVGTNAELALTAAVLGASASNSAVRFFDGKQVLGVVTNAPYRLVVSNWNRGLHLLSASAVVGGKVVTSCRVPLRAKSPPNDCFENSIHKTGERFIATGTLAGATPDAARYSYYPDVWFSWTAPRDGAFELRTGSAQFSVTVLTGTVASELTQVADWQYQERSVTFRAAAGTTYHFHVTSYFLVAPSPQKFQIRLRPTSTPANDDFANATELSGLPAEARGTLRHATREPNEQTFGASVWFKWTVPASGLFVATVDEPRTYASIAAYTGDAIDALSQRGGSIAGAIGTTLYAEQGEVIRFAVTSSSGNTNFTLRIAAHSPPPNDDFANSTELVGVPVLTNATSIGATREADEPADRFDFVSVGSVWWKWTAPTAGNYRAAIQLSPAAGSGPIARGFGSLAVYTGDGLRNLVRVASGDSGESVAFRADAGVAYHVALRATPMAGFSFSIVPAMPPANDDFAAATILVGAATSVSGTVRDATLEPGEPPHQYGFLPADSSVWYRWTAPSNGVFAISVSGLAFDLFSGDNLPGLSLLAGAANRHVFHASAGVEYRIAVYRARLYFGSVAPGFVIHIGPVTPPVNDDLANALLLTGADVSFQASGYNATRGTNDPLGDHSLWWRWTAPASGRFLLQSSDYGSFGAFIMTTNSELQTVTTSSGTKLSFTALAGVSYLIGAAVDAIGPTRYSLAFVPPPLNDDFENAAPIAAVPFTSTSSNDGGTGQPGEPNLPERSLWWTWTPLADQVVAISVATPDFTPVVVLYTGTALTNIEREFSSFGYPSVFHASANVTYHIAVDALGGFGTFTFDLTPVTPPPNDDFAHRLPMTNNTATGSTSGAGPDPTERFPEGGSVWWQWRAPTSGVFTVEAALYDTLALYTGDSLTNLAYVPIETFPQEIGVAAAFQKRGFWASQGTDYILRVSAPVESVHDYQVRFSYWPPPANDYFSNRIALAGARVTASATNTLARTEPGEPEWFSVERTLWWSWTAPGNGAYSISVLRSPAASAVRIYTGSAITNLTAPGAAYPSNGRLLIHAQAGISYAIQVGPNSNASSDRWVGKVILDIAPANAPANDDFAHRTVLSGTNLVVHGSNYEATAEIDEPIPSSGGPWFRQSVWYSWTPDRDGMATINVSSTNALFGIVAYTGTALTNLQIAATNHDNLPPLKFAATAGTTYSIWLDGSSSEASQFDLTIRLEPAAPLADGAFREKARELGLRTHGLPRVVEASTNLLDWTPFRTNLDGAAEIRLPMGREPQRFFRLR